MLFPIKGHLSVLIAILSRGFLSRRFLSGLVSILFVAGLVLSLAGAGPEPTASTTRRSPATSDQKQRTVQAYGNLPLAFEPNAGQTDPSVRFMAHVSGGTLYFTPSEVVLSLSTGNPTKLNNDGTQKEGRTAGLAAPARAKQPTPGPPTVVRMRFLDANLAQKIEQDEALPGKVNYFIGNDPSKWHANLPTYGGVTYSNLYPGIDLRYKGSGGQLKGTYTVAPGADPSLIKWSYAGAGSGDGTGVHRVTVDTEGNLQIHLAAGEGGITVTERLPVAWQQKQEGGELISVQAAYTVGKDGTVSFRVGAYDPSLPLTIDPTLSYSTYLGGSSDDYGYGIAVDSSGSAYVTGYTYSTDFPVVNAIQPTNHGPGDAFVTKLNAAGTALVYSTYLGGSSDDQGYGIAVDSSGSAYVSGDTGSWDFPVVNAIQPTNHGGVRDAFVTKLNAAGTALVYSTYLGGSTYDGGWAIAVDSSGSAYVTGYTYSTDFPVANAIQPTNHGWWDAFVTKLNAAGTALVYSTYLGGSSDDESWGGIAVDSNGNAYVSGYTDSGDFPVTNAIQPTNHGGYDAFVTKLNAAGTALVYSTYLGGYYDDESWGGIAVDSNGNAYVIGRTNSTDFPVVNAIQPTRNGSYDAFVTKLNAAGTALVYSTYLGGSGDDYGWGIAVDSSGNVYVSGWTTSTDFPVTNAIQPIFNGGVRDAFVTKLNAAGTALVYSTYLGGSGGEYAYETAVDSSGNAYVIGRTSSGDFPVANAIQPTNHGGYDAFIAKISPQGGATSTRTLTPSPTAVTFTRTPTRTSTPTQSPTPISPARTPLIFIPGIMGSYLYDKTNGANNELWPFSGDHNPLSLFPSDNPSPTRVISATDIIRSAGGVFDVYQTLVNTLTVQGGYVEYSGDTDPLQRTTSWCRDHRPSNSPTLFVFPYDWRRSNADTALALQDYIGCIREIYPGTQVDILTHSMGGLVARRYILDNPNNHHVGKLVTIASPWLGSPSSISVLETGEPIPLLPILDGTTKYLAGSFTGAHELLPSRAYYELGWPPLGEEGWDFNGNGQTYEQYTDPSQYLYAVSSRYGYDHPGNHVFYPGTAADNFHSYSNAGNQQDNWQSDTTGVSYYHFYGVQKEPATMASLVARRDSTCFANFVCVSRDYLQPQYGRGDKTVPLVSAERKGRGQDYNAPGATLIPEYSPDSSQDWSYEHGGLVKNPVVLDGVLAVLQTANPAAGSRLSAPQTTPTVPPMPPASPVHYLLISGARDVVASDAFGNSTAPITGTLEGQVPGVSIYQVGEDMQQLTVSTAGAYTVTFQTITSPLAITLDTGDTVSNTQAIRYQDLTIPPGVSSIITTTDSSVAQLRYDADGNGTYETPVTPTVAVSGTVPLDTESPRITITTAPQGNLVQVTIAATDTGSGLRDLLYSLDGSVYRPYTSSLMLDPVQVPAVYAFADDNMANRASAVQPISAPVVTPTVTTGTTTSTPTPVDPVTPTVRPCHITFTDVQAIDYFYQAVSYLYCMGAISGYSDNTFRPYNNTTRGQLSKIVTLAEGWPINTAGGPHFSDVPATHAFYQYIETAYDHAVISGYSDGTFKPGNNVTRGQLSKIVVSAEGWAITTQGGPHFSDVSADSPFYQYIETAYNASVISGYSDGTFRPGNNATRGQISKIVYQALLYAPPTPVPPTSTRTRTATATPTCGPSWHVVPNPDPGTGSDHELRGVASIPSGEAWAVGDSYDSTGTHYPLVERWDGANWNLVLASAAPAETKLLSIAAVSSTDIWAVGTNGSTITMHWDGSAWALVPSPHPGNGFSILYSVAAISSSDVWAVGAYAQDTTVHTLALHWDGTEWSIVASPDPPGAYNEFYAVAATARDDVWAVGYLNSGASKYTLIAHWNGTAWTQVQSPNNGNYNLCNSVTVVSPGDVWAGGTSIAHWNGNSWTTTITPVGIVYGLAAVSASNVWAVGSQGQGSETRGLILHWNGSVWSAVTGGDPGPDTSELRAVAASGSTQVWAVGSYGYNPATNLSALIERYFAPCLP